MAQGSCRGSLRGAPGQVHPGSISPRPYHGTATLPAAQVRAEIGRVYSPRMRRVSSQSRFIASIRGSMPSNGTMSRIQSTNSTETFLP